MILQVGTPNSASILLIRYWLQLGVLAARDTLIGGYLHRPICEIILWYWWTWSGGWHTTSRCWTLPWIFPL